MQRESPLVDTLHRPHDDGLDFLRQSKEAIFNRRQCEHLDSYSPPEAEHSKTIAVKSLYLIVKATRLCNLRCTYCHSWREGPNQVLSFEMLCSSIAEAMRLPGLRYLHIVWHGGETTLLSRKYFERAIWLQEHFRIDDRKVGHSIQTNATRIDDSWAAFFKVNDFSVGVSLDIDRPTHDRSRLFEDGSGSFADTMRGIETLRRHGVTHGTLAVCDEAVLDMGAERVMEALLATGVPSVGLLNALPAITPGSAGDRAYLPWNRYVAFLRELFAIWRARYMDRITIREIASLYAIVKGSSSRLCIYQGGCMGQYLTIEPDGRVSACDKYVGDDAYCFGNLNRQSLAEMLVDGDRLARVRKASNALIQRFSGCENYKYCRGGCPHDAMLNERFVAGVDCCGLKPLIDDMKMEMEESNGFDHDDERRL